MSKRRFGFTKDKLDKLAVPSGRAYFYDTKIPHLGIAVTASGTKTFVIYKRMGSVPKRYKLGRYPAMTIDAARIKAAEVNAEIAKGLDPQKAKRAALGERTFKTIFDEWLKVHAKPHKRTWKDDQRTFELYLGSLARRGLSRISRADLSELHERIGAGQLSDGDGGTIGGKYVANRVVALVSTVMNWAIQREYVAVNPCKGIKKYKENSRDRFLDAVEMKRFLKSVSQCDEPGTVDYVYLLLFTGARRSNVASMRWEHVDFERRTWTIPGGSFKTGKAKGIVLNKAALSILEARFEDRDEKNPWVFPSDSASGHLTTIKSAWRNIIKRAKLTDFRPHDLRRTAGSWAAAAGASELAIGKMLGHESSQSTRIYSRLNLDAIRGTVEGIGESMSKLLPGYVEGESNGKAN